MRNPQKACHDMSHGICVFAFGAICDSSSMVWYVQGEKHRRTIFHARVGLVRIPQKSVPRHVTPNLSFCIWVDL
jgi:hypothetical protein